MLARLLFAAGLCLALPLLLAAQTAFAQTAPTASLIAPSSWLFDAWTIVQPLATLFVSLVGPVLVTWIAMRLVGILRITDENKKKELEQRVREALHAAAENGLKYALAKAGLPFGSMPNASVLEDAIDYVRSKSPGTVKQSGVHDDDIEQIILSKVPNVLAQIAAGRIAPLPGTTKSGK